MYMDNKPNANRRVAPTTLEVRTLGVLLLEVLVVDVSGSRVGRRLSHCSTFASGLSGAAAPVAELEVLVLEVLELEVLKVPVMEVLVLLVLEELVLEALVLDVLEVLELLVLEVLVQEVLVLEVLELVVLEVLLLEVLEVEVLRIALSSSPVSSLPNFPEPESDLAYVASPTMTRVLATLVTDPSIASTVVSASVTKLIDFGSACHHDYLARLVIESKSSCHPFVGGELALGCDVFKDREFELKCLAAAVPHLAAMLLAPE
ncbi:unnamed protein product [Closterium sp. NIES-54]